MCARSRAHGSFARGPLLESSLSTEQENHYDRSPERRSRCVVRCQQSVLASLLIVLLISACSPAGPSTQSSGSSAPAAPQRTLTIAVRGEPPSLAARPLATFSGALAGGKYPFNATLDYRDGRGTALPLP